MKVYFSGSASTGKTSLARYVANKYQLPFLTETARQILSEQELQIDQLRCNLETANNYQRAVFNRQLQEENKYSSFVSDRAAIDILAYAGNYANILPELLLRSELPTYIESLKLPDSILFLVSPFKQTMAQDGTRETLSFSDIISIHAQIKLLLEMWNIRYFQISMPNMSERIKLIDGVLSLVKEINYEQKINQ